MRYDSTMQPREYLRHMKERMGSRLDIWSERFTGIFMGRFFYVTHHAGYEWNRRITNQKNAALGYVRETENGCEIRFLHFQGLLCPQFLIPWLLISVALLVLCWPAFEELPLMLIAAILMIVGFPVLFTCIESTTDGSIDGRKSLLGLLIDPSDMFASLHHQNEIG